MLFGRNRVVARASPRVAAQQAANAQIYAFAQAMDADGINHILGASGAKTANSGEQGGNKFLVESNAENQQAGQRVH